MIKRIIKRRKVHRSKITFTQKQILVKALEARMSVNRAVELAGIHQTTFHNWLRKGKNPRNRKYWLFRKKILKIQAQWETDSLKIIDTVAKGNYEIKETKCRTDGEGNVIDNITTIKNATPNWQAAAWFLKKRFKEDYGKDKNDIFEQAPEDAAKAIKEAADKLFNSVPLGEPIADDE